MRFATFKLHEGISAKVDHTFLPDSEQYFVDTEHLESRKELKAFVKQSTGVSEKDLQTKDLQPGSPKLVIVSGAALRVADVVRLVYA